jgi:hypothetical protein
MGETQYGLPLIVGNLADKAARWLKRVRFEKGADDSYNERWLQKLVSRYSSSSSSSSSGSGLSADRWAGFMSSITERTCLAASSPMPSS